MSAQLRATLLRCVNGCPAPPQPPSRVLCQKCFAELSAKMKELLGKPEP